MALTEDRNTLMQDGELIPVPLAANAKVFAGGIAVANASGYGAPGSVATTHTYLGRFNEAVDNTGGANGAKSALVRRGKAFKWKNSSGDPVTQASLGKTVYIEDDETVSATDGTGTQSAAGKMILLESDGVWVE